MGGEPAGGAVDTVGAVAGAAEGAAVGVVGGAVVGSSGGPGREVTRWQLSRRWHVLVTDGGLGWIMFVRGILGKS